jgi:predicted NUDIX family NTP pyrophosphohydrolase
MRTSAGLLLHRRCGGVLEVLLVHPGGPLFAGKDAGVWTIPKGEPLPGEPPVATARREFAEETGFSPEGPFVELPPITQRGGKRVLAWAVEGTWDPARLVCNTCRLEWPPRSGRFVEFPEVDRAEWCSVEVARHRMNPAQARWLDDLGALERQPSPAGERPTEEP